MALRINRNLSSKISGTKYINSYKYIKCNAYYGLLVFNPKLSVIKKCNEQGKLLKRLLLEGDVNCLNDLDPGRFKRSVLRAEEMDNLPIDEVCNKYSFSFEYALLIPNLKEINETTVIPNLGLFDSEKPFFIKKDFESGVLKEYVDTLESSKLRTLLHKKLRTPKEHTSILKTIEQFYIADFYDELVEQCVQGNKPVLSDYQQKNCLINYTEFEIKQRILDFMNYSKSHNRLFYVSLADKQVNQGWNIYNDKIVSNQHQQKKGTYFKGDVTLSSLPSFLTKDKKIKDNDKAIKDEEAVMQKGDLITEAYKDRHLNYYNNIDLLVSYVDDLSREEVRKYMRSLYNQDSLHNYVGLDSFVGIDWDLYAQHTIAFTNKHTSISFGDIYHYCYLDIVKKVYGRGGEKLLNIMETDRKELCINIKLTGVYEKDLVQSVEAKGAMTRPNLGLGEEVKALKQLLPDFEQGFLLSKFRLNAAGDISYTGLENYKRSYGETFNQYKNYIKDYFAVNEKIFSKDYVAQQEIPIKDSQLVRDIRSVIDPTFLDDAEYESIRNHRWQILNKFLDCYVYEVMNGSSHSLNYMPDILTNLVFFLETVVTNKEKFLEEVYSRLYNGKDPIFSHDKTMTKFVDKEKFTLYFKNRVMTRKDSYVPLILAICVIDVFIQFSKQMNLYMALKELEDPENNFIGNDEKFAEEMSANCLKPPAGKNFESEAYRYKQYTARDSLGGDSGREDATVFARKATMTKFCLLEQLDMFMVQLLRDSKYLDLDDNDPSQKNLRKELMLVV